jgi:hypothetical protein
MPVDASVAVVDAVVDVVPDGAPEGGAPSVAHPALVAPGHPVGNCMGWCLGVREEVDPDLWPRFYAVCEPEEATHLGWFSHQDVENEATCEYDTLRVLEHVMRVVSRADAPLKSWVVEGQMAIGWGVYRCRVADVADGVTLAPRDPGRPWVEAVWAEHGIEGTPVCAYEVDELLPLRQIARPERRRDRRSGWSARRLALSTLAEP